VITAADQLYFMGLFFLLAGYFTPGALARKGWRKFLVDRAIRLGIPLVLAYVFAAPYLELIKSQSLGHPTDGYWHELWWRLREGELGPGPLWFVETLLAFSLLYALVRPAQKRRAVGHRELALLAAAIAVTTFVIRIWWRPGEEFAHLQLAFFGQYGVLFFAGARLELDPMPARLAKVWGPAAVIAFSSLAALAEALGGIPAALPLVGGGLHWQAAVAAALESIYCVGAIAALLVLFRGRAGPLTARFAGDAYAVYVIHAIVLVTISFALRDWDGPPPAKMAVAATLAIATSFALSHYVLRRIPLVRRVL
jgi:hypothetical protein